jgi:hypothetical protein
MTRHDSPELLAALAARLSYAQDSGAVVWVGHAYRRAGTPAGTTRADGYRYVLFNGRRVLEHRIAWALHHGCWPSAQIDHINGIRNDNRLCNLRLASVAENNRNRPKQSNNTSGFKGVSFHKGTGRFHARITFQKRCHSLGYFVTAQEAHQAYACAVKEMHGEFGQS